MKNVLTYGLAKAELSFIVAKTIDFEPETLNYYSSGFRLIKIRFFVRLADLAFSSSKS